MSKRNHRHRRIGCVLIGITIAFAQGCSLMFSASPKNDPISPTEDFDRKTLVSLSLVAGNSFGILEIGGPSSGQKNIELASSGPLTR